MARILTGYVNLDDKGKNTYQFIYGTQSFCKFFCVYAKFTKIYSEKWKEEVITDIDFVLKNYSARGGYGFTSLTVTCNKNLLKFGIQFSSRSTKTKITKTNLSIRLSEFEKIFVSRDSKHIENLDIIDENMARDYRDDPNLNDSDIRELLPSFLNNVKFKLELKSNRDDINIYLQEIQKEFNLLDESSETYKKYANLPRFDNEGELNIDFEKQIEKKLNEKLTKSESKEILLQIKSAASVGENCRVSLLEVLPD